MLIPVHVTCISPYFIKIWPFKPCTLTKHVLWVSLYPNFPVKTLYFPVSMCLFLFHFFSVVFPCSIGHSVNRYLDTTLQMFAGNCRDSAGGFLQYLQGKPCNIYRFTEFAGKICIYYRVLPADIEKNSAESLQFPANICSVFKWP